jgi:hypothetical protein
LARASGLEWVPDEKMVPDGAWLPVGGPGSKLQLVSKVGSGVDYALVPRSTIITVLANAWVPAYGQFYLFISLTKGTVLKICPLSSPL